MNQKSLTTDKLILKRLKTIEDNQELLFHHQKEVSDQAWDDAHDYNLYLWSILLLVVAAILKTADRSYMLLTVLAVLIFLYAFIFGTTFDKLTLKDYKKEVNNNV